MSYFEHKRSIPMDYFDIPRSWTCRFGGGTSLEATVASVKTQR